MCEHVVMAGEQLTNVSRIQYQRRLKNNEGEKWIDCRKAIHKSDYQTKQTGVQAEDRGRSRVRF
jgi:hypothetical protein